MFYFNKEIKTNENVQVELKLPSPAKMPYGALAASRGMRADKIHRSVCKK